MRDPATLPRASRKSVCFPRCPGGVCLDCKNPDTSQGRHFGGSRALHTVKRCFCLSSPIYTWYRYIASFVEPERALEIAKFRLLPGAQTGIRRPPVSGTSTFISHTLSSRVSFPGLRRAYRRAQTLGVARRRRPERPRTALVSSDVAETARHTKDVLFFFAPEDSCCCLRLLRSRLRSLGLAVATALSRLPFFAGHLRPLRPPLQCLLRYPTLNPSMYLLFNTQQITHNSQGTRFYLLSTAAHQ